MKLRHMPATAILLTLPALSCEAAHAQTAPAKTESGVTEVVVTGRFFDTGAKSAMKMNVPVLDTPYSVASYSDTFVKSIDTTTVSDLYSYMTGVKKAGNTGYDISLRGFQSSGNDRNAIMVDGLPGLTGRYGSPPTVGVQRVELVKGPMSVLYGQIQPGGFVNLISKRPEREQSTEIEVRGNTFAGDKLDAFSQVGYTTSVDTTGPLVADKMLYRMIAEYGNRPGFRDNSYDHGLYVSPSLTFLIDPDTTFTAEVEYRKVRTSFDVGLAAPNNDIHLVAPITTVYQEPGNFRTEEGTSESLFLDHAFANGLQWHTGFRSVQYNSDQKEFSSVGIVNIAGTGPFSGFRVTRRARNLQTDRAYNYLDSSVTDHFTVAGLEQRVLVGLTLGKDRVHENRLKFFNSSTRNTTTGVCPAAGVCLDIGLYNPIYGQVPDFESLPATNPALANQTQLLTDSLVVSQSVGLYYSDLITLTDHLKLTLGGRTFQEDQQIDELRAPNGIHEKKTARRALLPSGGLLFQPNRHWTFYASYAESFANVDPTARDINGLNPFKPVEGKQYEVGAKTEGLFDGKLTATLAAFRIDQKGVLTTFACDRGTCSQQLGAARSDGIEFEANATPLEHWQLIVGYSHLNARVTDNPTDPFQVGKRLSNTADNSASIWSRYDFPNGFGVGMGVSYTGERDGVLVTSAAPQQLLLPAYTLTDAVLYYAHDNYVVNLKVGNVFDERYYESAGFTGRIQVAPGAPRNITLSAKARF